MGAEAVYGPECTARVERAVMVQRWEDLAFLHFRYQAAAVQRLLPDGLTVEQADGSAWVSLVPFRMWVGLALPGDRAVGLGPIGRFPETNVRTYVTAPDGTTGIWFFSLEAARLGAVVTARGTYRLPYFWADMSVERAGVRFTYATRRRWPGPRGASSTVVVTVGEPYAAEELTPLDHFLSARWTLFAPAPGGLRLARADHSPWPLRRARLLRCDDELLPAAGLPPPSGDPIVQWSPGVRVRIGPPERVSALPGSPGPA